MEKSIISTGKTIDAATEAALERLGLDRDNVSVEVLETPRSGFFGIGATPAKIRVTYEVPDETQPVTPAPALSSASRSTGPSQYEKLQARRRQEDAVRLHAASVDSCEGRLESLKVLYDAGILDRDEYAQRVERVKALHSHGRS